MFQFYTLKIVFGYCWRVSDDKKNAPGCHTTTTEDTEGQDSAAQELSFMHYVMGAGRLAQEAAEPVSPEGSHDLQGQA